MTEPIVIIRQGREKPVVQQHPWVFSGAIEETQGTPAPGEIVRVQDHRGQFLGRGYWNPRSQIQVRLLSWRDEDINESWWRNQLQTAIERRRVHGSGPTGERLVNAENDYLPGLIVDRYGDWLVVQALTLGIEVHKEQLVRLLQNLLEPTGIYERSDVDVRRKEGLVEQNGILRGPEPPTHIEIVENGARMLVDIRKGHKTGFYLDQADNRRLVNQIVKDQGQRNPIRVLNLFSYTGGFGIQALIGGATQAVNVDQSLEALELGETIAQLNGFGEGQAEFVQADVFSLLRDFARSGELFDLVILDPPKFAHNAGQVGKAARGYKDINLSALRCVRPGGYLMTFSCSGAISADLFQKITFGALVDSGRQAQVLRHLGPGPDHPVALTFPEGAYLKGLLLRVQ